MTPRAVLFDFGGVLTTSILESFSQFSEEISGDRELLVRVLSQDSEANRALVDHEEGRLDHEGFETVVAERLAAHGAEVAAEGLIAGMQRQMLPDPAMLDLLSRVREQGFLVGLVSNSLGRDCYAGFDLETLFDAQAISGVEGVRKPSRALYEIACHRLSVGTHQAIMIDDLEPNITAAAELDMDGIVHSDASETATALASKLGLAPGMFGGLASGEVDR